MEWLQQDDEALKQFRTVIDSDNIKIKETIKKVLLDNRFIVKVLNNKDLEEKDADPQDYFGVNILPYYMIKPTQHNVQNYICYTVSYKELERYNKCVKYLQITFVVLCNSKGVDESITGTCRHDLLAALIQDQFNYTNYFGSTIQLVEDQESIVDNDYACRTLIFEQITDNNLVKTRNGSPRLINKDVITLGDSN